jgi:4-amino-4-deoxy-L-arabinose transferase-like glycosyltransferase
VWITAPSLALLLLAATSAPGWLWRSEFGGYDALSYHLQLPKEWLASGRIEGLTHNVYSFLPGYVEAAYLHLMILRGDAIDSAYACQLLHALLALITALVTGRLAARIIGGERAALAGGAAAALVLGTPWVVVAGSLAYNEMAATLMLACGLLLLRATPRGAMRTALGLALLAAAACGAKLTALGFVALPLVVLLLASTPWRRWPAIAIAGALSSAVVLSPWLIGNAFVAGNPVFPFFGSVLGYGHWSAEQAAIFREGHLFSGGLGDRLVALWNQWLRHGMGANPRAGEPWLPQWSILPWLAIAGTIIAAVRGASRSALARLWCVIGVQLVFWLLATHLQSRFLLPVVVPCAVLAACGFAAIVRVTSRAAGAFAAILLLAWSVAPVMIFRGEAGGAPAARVGFAAIMAGKGLSDEQAEIAARGGARAIAINRLLPGSALVLLVGDATPFYHTRPIAYQTTWDRGPFSAAMREIPDDPASWIESLRRRGFTHLLVDPVMLRIWDRFRWNDSLLTADRVLRAAETHAEAIARFPDGSAIYCLTPPP